MLLFLLLLPPARILSAAGQPPGIDADRALYKVGVTRTGVYKLDRDDLGSLGMNVSEVDPHRVALASIPSTSPLPQENSAVVEDQLLEFPMAFLGDSDASLTSDEYFLFFGKSPHQVVSNNGRQEYLQNIYSDTTYYFLYLKNVAARRIEPAAPVTNAGTHPEVSSFPQAIAYGQDRFKPLNSGREWYSNRLLVAEDLILEVPFETPNALGNLRVWAQLFSQAHHPGGSFAFGVAPYSPIQTDIELQILDSSSEVPATQAVAYKHELELSEMGYRSPRLVVRTELSDPGGSGPLVVYLDKMVVSYDRDLVFDGSQLLFDNQNVPAGQVANMKMEFSGNPPLLWEVSRHEQVRSVGYQLQQGGLRFPVENTAERRFLAFFADTAFTPQLFGKTTMTSYRNISGVTGLVITAAQFETEAQRLADFHLAKDGIMSRVLVVQDIYLEFSGGRQDVSAIRNCVKHIYEQSPQLKYLLLFGKASLDYKDRFNDNKNLVPTYESRESLIIANSYASDDFFGFLEDDEGFWAEEGSGAHTLDLAIGRIPARNPQEAQDAVNKIIYYANLRGSGGAWKNKITYVADDGDLNSFIDYSERFIRLVKNVRPQLSFNKLYLQLFEQELSENNVETSPAFRTEFKKVLEEGTFVVNYIGHGNPTIWADEKILDFELIRSLKNWDRLPLFFTATCSFGYFDDPVLGTSGAEELVLKSDGGAIAAITTARPVFPQASILASESFHNFLFGQVDGDFLRIGEIFKGMKNNSLDLNGVENRNLVLIGDPMLRLNYPAQEMNIVSVNGKPVIPNAITVIRTLEVAEMTGEVVNSDGTVDKDFFGTTLVTVLDSEYSENTALSPGQDPGRWRKEISRQDHRIFHGQSRVTGGVFSFRFIPPQDVTYQSRGGGPGEGKVVMYATSDDDSQDASGAFSGLDISGAGQSMGEDKMGPEIEMYLNHQGFENRDQVGVDNVLFAHVTDENGINTTGVGLGHHILLTLDQQDHFILDNHYTADLDTYQMGLVQFPLPILAEGNHHAELQVWDVRNNPAVSSIEFYVAAGRAIELFDLRSYPNPTNGPVNLSFRHDRPSMEIFSGEFRIYNSAGRLMGGEEFRSRNAPGGQQVLSFSLKPGLPEGVYLYTIFIEDSRGGSSNPYAERIIIGR